MKKWEYNKVDINLICGRCLNKRTDFQGLTVKEFYNLFYTDPAFADKRNNHKIVNSIIIQALLAQHDCTRCLSLAFEF